MSSPASDDLPEVFPPTLREVMLRGRWIAMLLLCLAVAGVFAWLGQWQLARAIDTAPREEGATEEVMPIAEVAVPGQYLTEKWPVLHAGSVPRVDLATWDFKVWGQVEEPLAEPPAVATPPAPVQLQPPAPVRTLPTPTRDNPVAADDAPRTLRLRAETAQRLRGAWLEAKRDDVLLTAQDFASDLVDEALSRRRRRTVNS